ncbi:MAG: N-acetyltransferase [Deltaproteobacteria bacterium]|nr:MAG: N-acetyltransferase [Deltaproteobacteria bacterium]
MKVRKATISDVAQIHKIINEFAKKGDLLPRSLSELYDHLRDYNVIEPPGGDGTIVGVCGLGICWEDLAEIKSLAVIPSQQGKGYGKKLVEASLEEAVHFGIPRVFTLTYVPEFFRRLGFEETDKARLPQKIWADCLKCPHFPDCKEVALIKHLS